MDYKKLQGTFLVVDGPDGAGKSTQVKLLGEWIREHGVSTVLCRDPGGTRIGEAIRKILLSPDHTEMSIRCETLLYMASRAQLYAEVILPGLSTGHCVISDRWLSSTYAYQAAAGKLGSDQLDLIAKATLERPWPDLTVIIDLKSDTALERVGPEPDRMEQKGTMFHADVREAFLTQARKHQHYVVVDGNGTIEQVHQRICDAVNDYVNL